MIKKCLQSWIRFNWLFLTFCTNRKTFRNILENLEKHCGKSLRKANCLNILRDDFAGKKLTMHVKSCSANEIKIPFNVGDNYFENVDLD